MLIFNLNCNPRFHTASVGLLLNPLGGKDRMNSLACIGSNPLSPFVETVTVPFQIFLVIGGHMLRNRAVLPLSAIQTAVGSNAAVIVKDFDNRVGYPHIHLTFNEFVRNGV